ncbi:putative ATP-dependent RNA helicase DHX8 [Seiridium cardinale]
MSPHRARNLPADAFSKVLYTFWQHGHTPLSEDDLSRRPQDHGTRKTQQKLHLGDLPGELLFEICIQFPSIDCLYRFARTCQAFAAFCHKHQRKIIKHWLLRQLPSSYVRLALLAFISSSAPLRRADEFDELLNELAYPKHIAEKHFDIDTAISLLRLGAHAEVLINVVTEQSSNEMVRLHTFSETRRAVEALLIMDTAAMLFHRDDRDEVLLRPSHPELLERFWNMFSPQKLLEINSAAAFLHVAFKESTPFSTTNLYQRQTGIADANMERSKNPSPSRTVQPARPYREIRAVYDDETITVYQAYNADIASEAVKHQNLNASPLFKPVRMTWIKPSWCWMMYRSGYSYKDENQERILALKMRQEDFLNLLKKSKLTTEKTEGPEDGEKGGSSAGGAEVKVQWDPERTARLGRLDYRSIQIGIRGSLRTEWVDKWIVEIQDVTERARALKVALDENPESADQALVERGLMPLERAFEVSSSLREVLGMESHSKSDCGQGSPGAKLPDIYNRDRQELELTTRNVETEMIECAQGRNATGLMTPNAPKSQ